MPKRYRYRIVKASSSFTWKYEDTDENPPKVLEESRNKWDTKRLAREAIRNMQEADIVEDP